MCSNSSSSSDSYENFLQQIQKSNPTQVKYRLSTGSLYDFITDNGSSNTSNDDNDENYTKEEMKIKMHSSLLCHSLNGTTAGKAKCFQNEKKRLKSVVTPKRSVVFSSDENSFSNGNNGKKSCKEEMPKKTPLNLKYHLYNKTAGVNSHCSVKNTRKLKSVVTPRRPVTFSSESEDDVFLSARAPVNSKLNYSYSFTDSEKENDAEFLLPVPRVLNFEKGEKDCHSSSKDENSPNCNGGHCSTQIDGVNDLLQVTSKMKSMMISDCDSDADGDVISLKDRISNPYPTLNTAYNFVQPKGRNHSIENTPLKSRNLNILKPFLTEQVNRKCTKLCSVRDCFLSSLDTLFSSQYSRAKFKKEKQELNARLYKLFNDSVFDGLLPESMQLIWSKRLTKTAGFTKCRKVLKTYRDNPSADAITAHSYEATITLSEKIIDCAARLRDTLIHEMCHAAVWLLNNANESHGPFWKSWAAKARRIHPELPPIERCHNYDINHKYKYQCTRCSSTIGRHSKSIDTSKKVCGKCRGTLVLLTKTRAGNPFSNFVKANYKTTKTHLESSCASASHRDVMKSLSDQFKAVSLSSGSAGANAGNS